MMNWMQIVLTFLGVVAGFCSAMAAMTATGAPMGARLMVAGIGLLSIFFAWTYSQMLGNISSLQRRLDAADEDRGVLRSRIQRLGIAIRDYMSADDRRRCLLANAELYWKNRSAYVASLQPRTSSGDTIEQVRMINAAGAFDSLLDDFRWAGVTITRDDEDEIYTASRLAESGGAAPESPQAPADPKMREKLDNLRTAVADLNSLSDQ